MPWTESGAPAPPLALSLYHCCPVVPARPLPHTMNNCCSSYPAAVAVASAAVTVNAIACRHCLLVVSGSWRCSILQRSLLLETLIAPWMLLLLPLLNTWCCHQRYPLTSLLSDCWCVAGWRQLARVSIFLLLIALLIPPLPLPLAAHSRWRAAFACFFFLSCWLYYNNGRGSTR